MKRYNALALAGSLVFALAARAMEPLPPDLATAIEAYDRAQVGGDRAALERLLAEDYTLVNSRAQVQTKAEFIADSVAPGFHLEPFTVEHPLHKLWGDGAVLSGEVLLKGTSDGESFQARVRFADIWRKRNGRWQVVFTEVTALPHDAAR